MADGGVDIDLYADDIESDFNRQDEFGGENVDLYDDVIAAPPVKTEDDGPPNVGGNHHPPEEQNGNNSYHNNGPSHGHHGRRFQLYVGNLTWGKDGHPKPAIEPTTIATSHEFIVSGTYIN